MLRTRLLALALPLLLIVVTPGAAEPGDDAPEKKFGDFAKLTKGAKEVDGLFKLWHKDDHVYMEIQPQQFDKPLLAPIAIARGLGSGGTTLNDDDQWVLVFRRVGDKVHLIRRNVRYQAKPGTPAAKAVETTYADSVIMALKIEALNPIRNAVVIDLNEIFFTDFARLPLGSIDTSRTVWQKVKGYPKNIELQVAATYTGGGRENGVIDSRGKTVVIHYGLVELPDSYQPRLADDRVGYFLTVVKDFSSESRESSFVRYVNRWRLERADGSPWKEGAKVVPPKKKIVFWIEKSVPDEYRAAVREGILEWNKAFEAIGFRDAIEVRQQENEDFDPEDINYNTFRWTTNDQGYAIGPSRANPLTGEILDADILFDASMVRYWKTSHLVQRPGKGYEEPASLIQASQRGWLMPRPSLIIGQSGWDSRPAADPEEQLRLHFQMFRQGMCQCASQKRFELGLGAMTWMARNPGEKVPDELIAQSIKETTMHEVGHTLGLRHNFKASTMLKSEQLHDTNLTRKKGLVGSVMDYNPVNLAPKGVKQGDYFSTTIGPYDYWAIEYGYKPLSGGTDGEVDDLKKIASKSAQPGLDYGTDEDLLAGPDPLCNQWDLGSDPMKFAQDRIVLAEELLKGLADRVVEKGESYQATRGAFGMLLRQYGDGAYLVSRHVGGVELHRDHRGDANGRDPFVPLTGARQRNALKFLQEHILTDKPFSFPPDLLRKLAADRWMHWGNEQNVMRNVDYTLYDRILRIQAVVLDELIDAATLARIQNNAVRSDKDDQPLTVAEVFRALTDSVWGDLPSGDKPAPQPSSVILRNIQREYLQRLTTLVLGKRTGGEGFFAILLGGGASVPPDALSLARMHLRDTAKRIDLALADKKSTADDTTRAHLEECKERIAKVLSASMQVSE
jgi:hypothetical protein